MYELVSAIIQGAQRKRYSCTSSENLANCVLAHSNLLLAETLGAIVIPSFISVPTPRSAEVGMSFAVALFSGA